MATLTDFYAMDTFTKRLAQHEAEILVRANEAVIIADAVNLLRLGKPSDYFIAEVKRFVTGGADVNISDKSSAFSTSYIVDVPTMWEMRHAYS
jgi:hypothetical protein